MLTTVEETRGGEKSRRASPRRWTVSGEGEGSVTSKPRARLVVLREAARAELELAADLGILREAARAELRVFACERRESRATSARGRFAAFSRCHSARIGRGAS